MDDVESSDLAADQIMSISLMGRLADFEDKEADEREDDEDLELSCCFDVVPLELNRFRLVAPTSMTPFGPYGPMLNLGDVIEAAPLDDGTYQYVRTLECGRVRTWTLTGIGLEALEQAEPKHLLEKLVSEGGNWELVAGNLTMQIAQDDYDSALPGGIASALSHLVEILTSPTSPS